MPVEVPASSVVCSGRFGVSRARHARHRDSERRRFVDVPSGGTARRRVGTLVRLRPGVQVIVVGSNEGERHFLTGSRYRVDWASPFATELEPLGSAWRSGVSRAAARAGLSRAPRCVGICDLMLAGSSRRIRFPQPLSAPPPARGGQHGRTVGPVVTDQVVERMRTSSNSGHPDTCASTRRATCGTEMSSVSTARSAMSFESRRAANLAALPPYSRNSFECQTRGGPSATGTFDLTASHDPGCQCLRACPKATQGQNPTFDSLLEPLTLLRRDHDPGHDQASRTGRLQS